MTTFELPSKSYIATWTFSDSDRPGTSHYRFFLAPEFKKWLIENFGHGNHFGEQTSNGSVTWFTRYEGKLDACVISFENDQDAMLYKLMQNDSVFPA